MIVAVHRPIIGIDFLFYYGLLVDTRRKHFVDETTHQTAKGSTLGIKQQISIKHTNSGYHETVAKYPEMVRLAEIELEYVKHNMTHNIKTTSSYPV